MPRAAIPPRRMQADQRQLSTLLKAASLTVLAPERWQEHVPVSVDGETLQLRWAAKPRERQWAVSGSPLGEA